MRRCWKRITTMIMVFALLVTNLPIDALAADSYESKLPVVYIDTENGQKIESKDDYINATMRIQGNDTYSDSKKLYDGAIEIKGRGNSTWNMPKKPYKIKLDKKTDILGMGKNKHWVLLANYSDESLMRNKLVYDFSGLLGMPYMESTWVDVVMNGEYVGTYQLCEQIRVDGTRVDIHDWESFAEDSAAEIATQEALSEEMKSDLETFMKEKDMSWITSGKVAFGGKIYNVDEYGIEIPSINGGYLMELDEYFDEVSRFKTNNGQPIMFKNPEFVSTNKDMISYVQNYIQSFEDAVNSDDYVAEYDGEKLHYSELFDFDALVDYWLINEIFFNEEFNKKSTYMYKDTDELVKMGPMWDMDYSSNGEGDTWYTDQWATLFFDRNAQRNMWYKNLVHDPYFLMKAQERYWEIHDTAIAGLVPKINEYYELISESGKNNSKIWPYKQSFDKDVRGLSEWLTSHIAWLDTKMATEDTLTNEFFTPATNLELTLTTLDGKQLPADTTKSAPADVVAPGQNGLKLSVYSSDLRGVANIYVNGKMIGNVTLGTTATEYFTIPAKYLTADVDEKNVIEVKVGGNYQKVLAENYITVRESGNTTITYEQEDLKFLSYCDLGTTNTWDQTLAPMTSTQAATIKACIDKEIVKSGMTDYEKAEAIFQWIRTNIGVADNSTSTIGIAPYDVFTIKKAVCGGFANLYKAMLNLAGVPAVCITGTTPQGAHEWNAIYTEKGWFYSDAIWGYFDIGAEDFLKDHFVGKVCSASVADDKGNVLGYESGVAVIGTTGSKNVIVPNMYKDLKVKTVSNELLDKKYGVESIYVGENIENIVVVDSDTLKSVSVASGNVKYAAKDGVLFTKDMSQLLLYPSQKTSESYTIPAKTTEYDSKMTFSNTYLKNIQVETGNKKFSSYDGAVYNYNKTQLLTVPHGKTEINIAGTAILDTASLSFKDNLQTVVLEKGITKIPAYAFNNCSNLKKLYIPATVTSISKDALHAVNTSKLTIYGTSDSYAKTFAKNNKIVFEATDGNKWTLVDGVWYYRDLQGENLTGWQKIGGSWYYFTNEGKMTTGWQKVNGVWYYMRSNGTMATGWLQVGSTWYYMRSNGAMATGWVQVGSTWYYMRSNGAMATGWVQVGSTWYYMRSSGAMATGWVHIGNYWYYMESSGAMVTGWKRINGSWYYFYSSGQMAASTWVGSYYVNSSGQWL